MIGSLRGRLLSRSTDGELLVEVHGVGYRVVMGPVAATTIGDIGDEVVVHVHHHQRDDAQILFGFRDADERRYFETLLATHGVGPALALAIISVHGPVALAQIVADGDADALCLVPGVGKKTAARLLVELRARLPENDALTAQGRGEPVSVGVGPIADVREALTGLGYGPDEIRVALRTLPAEGDAAALLRDALRVLGTGGAAGA